MYPQRTGAFPPRFLDNTLSGICRTAGKLLPLFQYKWSAHARARLNISSVRNKPKPRKEFFAIEANAALSIVAKLIPASSFL